MTDSHPAYLPPELVAQLTYELPDVLTEDDRWAIARLAERAYAQGYSAGHLRGHTDGRESGKRARLPLHELVTTPRPAPANALEG